MDKGSKADALKHWRMEAPYYAFDAGGLRFVVLDLNTLRRGDAYEPYANANFYDDSYERNWCDPKQLEWLDAELRSSKRPTVIFSHQPIGLSTRGTWLPRSQRAILEVIEGACKDDGAGRDRLHERPPPRRSRAPREGAVLPERELASYHWSQGMRPYANPLFAFVTIEPEGRLRVEGERSTFVDGHPWDAGLSREVDGVTASISDRAVVLRRG